MNSHTSFLSPDTKGSTPLWIAFWLFGVVFSHVLFAGVVLLYAKVSSTAMAVALAGFVVYTAWIMRVVWVNADNVRNPVYGNIARFLTVAWAINSLLVSGFMLLSHIAGEPLPLPF